MMKEEPQTILRVYLNDLIQIIEELVAVIKQGRNPQPEWDTYQGIMSRLDNLVSANLTSNFKEYESELKEFRKARLRLIKNIKSKNKNTPQSEIELLTQLLESANQVIISSRKIDKYS